MTTMLDGQISMTTDEAIAGGLALETKCLLDRLKGTPKAGGASYSVAPGWESVGEQLDRVDVLRAKLVLAKDRVKELLADPDLVEAQEEVKACKQLLAEGLAALEELCRQRARGGRRVDTSTGEVLS